MECPYTILRMRQSYLSTENPRQSPTQEENKVHGIVWYQREIKQKRKQVLDSSVGTEELSGLRKDL